MENKLRYKNWVVYAAYVCAFIGVVALLSVAKIYSGNKKVSSILITLNGKDKVYFLEEADIKNRIVTLYPSITTGARVKQINTKLLESNFAKDPWINKAEVYFDRNENLIVNITQTQPVARIITNNGTSYYVDTLGKWLPMLAKFTPRLPIVTNYPAQKDGRPANDSIIKNGILTVGKIFMVDSFWQAQFAQLAIEGNNWILIPTLGSHKIVLGEPILLEEKFVRLKKFYMQYGAVHSLDKYEKLLVQFDKQIVAVKRGETAAVIKDSLTTRALMNNWDSTQNVVAPTPIIIEDTVDGSSDYIINAPTLPLRQSATQPTRQVQTNRPTRPAAVTTNGANSNRTNANTPRLSATRPTVNKPANNRPTTRNNQNQIRH